MAERTVADPEAMLALGGELAAALRPPAVVALEGPLGAGKTTLVRGWLRALGHTGPVRSPTYTLLETYVLPSVHVYHLDLYRLVDPEELEFIGVRDLAAADALWLIEWPERGAGRLPPIDQRIRIDYHGATRRVQGLPGAARGPSRS